MQVETRLKIKSNPNLYRYLRENSYWYKYLNRSPIFLKHLEEEMKEKYARNQSASCKNSCGRGADCV